MPGGRPVNHFILDYTLMNYSVKVITYIEERKVVRRLLYHFD